jgi:hypothetical protein
LRKEAQKKGLSSGQIVLYEPDRPNKTKQERASTNRIVVAVAKDWETRRPRTTPPIVLNGNMLKEVSDKLNRMPEWGQGGRFEEADALAACLIGAEISEIAGLVSDANNIIQEQHDQYDIDTNHGQLEGVGLDISIT